MGPGGVDAGKWIHTLQGRRPTLPSRGLSECERGISVLFRPSSRKREHGSIQVEASCRKSLFDRRDSAGLCVAAGGSGADCEGLRGEVKDGREAGGSFDAGEAHGHQQGARTTDP